MSKTDDELRSFLQCYTTRGISPIAIRVADLLDRWLGLHHVSPDALARTDWSHAYYISFRICVDELGGELATFDSDELTELVFLAHELCIRVALSPVSHRYFQFKFHLRKRGGDFAERHLTLDEAVATFRCLGVPVRQPVAAAEASSS